VGQARQAPPQAHPTRPGRLLVRYIESRRPAHIPRDVWARRDTPLLRHPPTDRFPEGRPVGKRRTHRLFTALHDAAPDLFADGDLSCTATGTPSAPSSRPGTAGR
jgi:hypothetical protein